MPSESDKALYRKKEQDCVGCEDLGLPICSGGIMLSEGPLTFVGLPNIIKVRWEPYLPACCLQIIVVVLHVLVNYLSVLIFCLLILTVTLQAWNIQTTRLT